MNDKVLSTLYVGIDVSLAKNNVTAIDFHEKVFFKETITNNLPGADSFISAILKCLDEFKFTDIVVAIESTSIYSTHIATFIASNIILKAFNTRVYVLNPKTTSNYRKTFVNLQKTDPEDSYLLADFARMNKIKSHAWKGDQHLAIKRLTRHRLHIVELLTKEKTYYQSNLFLKFSEFARLKGKNKLFSNHFGNTASSLLEEMLSLDDIAYMPIEDLADFVIDKSNNHIENPTELAKAIKKAARDSYKLDKLAYEPITHALASSLNLIKFYQNELKEIDKAITKVIKGFQNNAFTILTSIKGIGPVLAAGIIAEIGDIKSFKNNDTLAQYSGITWSRDDSGPRSNDDTKLTKRGNKYLRYYLIEAANSVRRYDTDYMNYFDSKFKEVHTHQHQRALALTSRRLIRLIFGLLDKNNLYDPNYNTK